MKILKKSFSARMLEFGMKHRLVVPYQVCSNGDLGFWVSKVPYGGRSVV